MYDYREQMKADVRDYIEENIGFIDYEDLDKYSDSETEELYVEKEDFNKVISKIESQKIAYEYDEEKTELKIFSDDYDIVTEILDELEIEY